MYQVMAASPLAVVRNRSNVGSGYYLDIFYRNIRGLRTKPIEIFNNVCSFDFKIICLTKTWLNESHYSQNLFPEVCTVHRSDRDCHTKLRGGGALIAVSEADFGVKCRSDLEYFKKCVWVEITVTGGRRLLIGNHYFAPDVKVDIIKNYFNCLENILDNLNYRVLLLGDFNVPGFDWNSGFVSSV
jgi:hypothetical protein